MKAFRVGALAPAGNLSGRDIMKSNMKKYIKKVNSL